MEFVLSHGLGTLSSFLCHLSSLRVERPGLFGIPSVQRGACSGRKENASEGTSSPKSFCGSPGTCLVSLSGAVPSLPLSPFSLSQQICPLATTADLPVASVHQAHVRHYSKEVRVLTEPSPSVSSVSLGGSGDLWALTVTTLSHWFLFALTASWWRPRWDLAVVFARRRWFLCSCL